MNKMRNKERFVAGSVFNCLLETQVKIWIEATKWYKLYDLWVVNI